MKSKLVFLIVLSLLLTVSLTACDQDLNKKEDTEVTKESKEKVDLSEEELEKEIKNIEDEYELNDKQDSFAAQKDYKGNSPFTGLPLTQEYYQRAVAVSIENSPAARPQSGLDKAEIVYEFMLEGGITRFLAIFWPEIPEKAGPIRSARPALIETSQNFDSLFLHAGASPDGFALLQQNNVLHLDQIYQSKYFWRSSKRKAPHNLFSGKKPLKDYVNNLAPKEYPQYFNFLTASVISDFKKAEKIEIDYWGSYSVLYEYNKLENNYLRYLNNWNNPHQVENGDQIEVKNIIVQFVETSTKDEQGRQEIKLNSNGKMILFRDGIVIEGNWKNNGNKTSYYNNEEEIEVNPGKTWIQIVPTNTEIDY